MKPAADFADDGFVRFVPPRLDSGIILEDDYRRGPIVASPSVIIADVRGSKPNLLRLALKYLLDLCRCHSFFNSVKIRLRHARTRRHHSNDSQRQAEANRQKSDDQEQSFLSHHVNRMLVLGIRKGDCKRASMAKSPANDGFFEMWFRGHVETHAGQCCRNRN